MRGDRDKGPPRCRRTARRTGRAPAPATAKFLVALWAASRAWDQNAPASNDLRGGNSGIVLPPARKFPRPLADPSRLGTEHGMRQMVGTEYCFEPPHVVEGGQVHRLCKNP